MMAESSNFDRLLKLMGEQALFGLDQGEQHELTELAAKHPNVQADEMDVLAAEIELSALPATQLKLPDHCSSRFGWLCQAVILLAQSLNLRTPLNATG